MPPQVTIGRLATRILAEDPQAGLAASRLAHSAARRLGPYLDAALPAALRAAGVAEDVFLAIPALKLRLRIDGEASVAELAAAWADALAAAVAAALPAARHEPAAASPTEAPAVLFEDAWTVEAVLLRAAARGQAPPWWSRGAAADLTQPGRTARLLAEWIGRDPARAAAEMTALLAAVPPIAATLTAQEAAALAEQFCSALRRNFADVASYGAGGGSQPGGRSEQGRHLSPLYLVSADAAGLEPLRARLPETVRAALAALPSELRAPWLAAAVLSRAPAWAALLPSLLPALATGTGTRSPVSPPQSGDLAFAVEQPQAVAAQTVPGSVKVAEVLAGGLLLLLRPIARLAPEWLYLADALPSRLLAVGLLALHRLTAQLPPAARRAAMERDRDLLGVFCGRPPPDAPLDTLAVASPQAEDMLARLLAEAPPGVDLRRLVLRPGRLRWDDAMAELIWPDTAVDVALRRAGWDIDPGWLPWIGRRVTFRYEPGGGA